MRGEHKLLPIPFLMALWFSLRANQPLSNWAYFGEAKPVMATWCNHSGAGGAAIAII